MSFCGVLSIFVCRVVILVTNIVFHRGDVIILRWISACRPSERGAEGSDENTLSSGYSPGRSSSVFVVATSPFTPFHPLHSPWQPSFFIILMDNHNLITTHPMFESGWWGTFHPTLLLFTLSGKRKRIRHFIHCSAPAEKNFSQRY